MDTKLGAAAFALIALLVGVGAGAAMTHVARADLRIAPDTTCGTSMPCVTDSNTAGGPGLKSTSAHGNGLVATTNAAGSTSQNSGNALLGQDLQTKSGNGVMNAGVKGTSANGTGVAGAGQIGVGGTTSSDTGIGVLASAPFDATVLEGQGGGQTVLDVSGSGQATFGPNTNGATGQVRVNGTCGSGTPMFQAVSAGLGQLFQVSDCGNVIVGGQLDAAAGLFTNDIHAASFPDVGIDAPLSATQGLLSFSPQGNGTNYVATDSAGVTWLYQGYSATAGKFTVEMGDSGSVYARIFITMNEMRVSQPSNSGARIDTYTPQTSQPSLDDFGEAQLSGGTATVALDPKFVSVIDRSTRYYVMLTPEGDCRGLYVAQRDPTSFTVRELQAGRSSIAFTYRIVAKPLGDDSPRLPASTLPYGFEHTVAPPHAISTSRHHVRATHR